MNQNFKEEKNEDNITDSITDNIADSIAGSMIEITLEQWNALRETDTLLIDIRDSVSYQHGFITGAVNISREELLANPDTLPRDKKIILYCMKGVLSRDMAETLREKGYDAYDLYEGYAGWIVWMMKKEKEQDLLLRAEEIEKSLRKKFHKDLFGRFAKAVNQYDLIQEN
ncbi:MAG: rhodanese-like domain-containing protein, partial [Lachnospiraceae bacterium]|nr:rhodanese-like domain-containing protein [Lachnospiraceae bacterium]